MRNIRIPHVKDIILTLDTVKRFVPRDEGTEFRYGWRKSLKHVPNFRVSGTTADTPWTVDIYHGSYYVVIVGSHFAENFSSVMTLVGFLRRMLGVR